MIDPNPTQKAINFRHRLATLIGGHLTIEIIPDQATVVILVERAETWVDTLADSPTVHLPFRLSFAFQPAFYESASAEFLAGFLYALYTITSPDHNETT